MKTILLQKSNSPENRAIIQAIALSNGFKSEVYDSDRNYKTELENGWVPVGSVEFIRDMLKVLGKPFPDVNCYPIIEYKYLKRALLKIDVQYFKEFLYTDNYTKGIFLKPVSVKLFNGFVYKGFSRLDDYEKEQLDILLNLAPEELLWVSSHIELLSEWRYYIDGNDIVGYGRYDDNDNEGSELEPDIGIIYEYIDMLGIKHPYSLDWGVSSFGHTVLVEYNDFFALGYYKGSLTQRQYLELLVKRWSLIV